MCGVGTQNTVIKRHRNRQRRVSLHPTTTSDSDFVVFPTFCFHSHYRVLHHCQSTISPASSSLLLVLVFTISSSHQCCYNHRRHLHITFLFLLLLLHYHSPLVTCTLNQLLELLHQLLALSVSYSRSLWLFADVGLSIARVLHVCISRTVPWPCRRAVACSRGLWPWPPVAWPGRVCTPGRPGLL